MNMTATKTQPVPTLEDAKLSPIPLRESGKMLRLVRVRAEIESDDTLPDEIPSLLGVLTGGEGSIEDVERLYTLAERRADLNDQILDMTAETIRLLQEEAGVLPDIDREERALIHLLHSSPREPTSVYVAVRHGSIVAEGPSPAVVGQWIEAERKRRARPCYHATLLSVSELRELTGPGGLVTAGDAELWRFARSRRLSADARLRALKELIERGHADVPAFVTEQLHRALRPREGAPGEPARAFRDGLLLAAERVVVRDPALRARLTDSLFYHAYELRGDGASDALWAAIRRYASLVPARDAGRLLTFLGDELPSWTHQVVFQAIANVFHVEPPPDDAPLDALRARVVALAERYLCPERPTEGLSGAEMSLALTAFVAAAALGSEALPRLEERLLSLPERWLAAEARQRLGALAGRWRRRALAMVEESAARLDRAGAGPT